MVQRETRLRVVDNTGGLMVCCIGILGGSARSIAAQPGSCLIVAVKSMRFLRVPVTFRRRKLKIHDVCKALLLRTRSWFFRDLGMGVRFGNNDVVLLNWNNAPKGSRISGPIPYELRDSVTMKFLSVSQGSI